MEGRPEVLVEAVADPVLLGCLAGVVPEAAPFLDQTGGLAEVHPLVLAEIEGL